MNPDRLSLEQLAAATELTPRNIRSYIAMQLLRGPEGKGRAAFYTSYHRERLLAVRALMEREGLTLSSIGASLSRMSQDEVQALAATMDPVGSEGETLASGPGAAAEYLRNLGFSARASRTPSRWSVGRSSRAPMRSAIRPATNEDAEQARQAHRSSERSRTLTPIDQLGSELGRMLRGRSVPRQSRGEPWFRIPVTPDLELAVRGALDGPELARLERIADHLRQILLGGLEPQ